MDSPEVLKLLVDVHRMAGEHSERLKNIEHAINGNGKIGLVSEVVNIKDKVNSWTSDHAFQLRVGSIIVALGTVIGSVLGFLIVSSKAIAG